MEGSEEEEEEVKYRISVFIASLRHLFPVKWTSHIQLWITNLNKVDICGTGNCFVLYFFLIVR